MTTLDQRSGSCSPVSGAFKPVEDVGAPGVVDLVKRMSIGLLNSHCVTERERPRRNFNMKKNTISVYILIFCLLHFN